MNKRAIEQPLRQKGAILLATLFCLSALAGCTSAQKKETEKPLIQEAQETQQVQQNSTAEKSTKKEEGKKPASQKQSEKKDGNQAKTAKPKPTKK